MQKVSAHTLAVLIPAYLPTLKLREEVSFRCICRVLSKRILILVTPHDLAIDKYLIIAKEEHVELKHETFDASFFKGLAGYNKLLLSEHFHRRWQNYEYFLIAQLDTYFFEDNLDYWMKQGYDFVGPPITGHWKDTNLDLTTMRIGNGGLSLRRTQAYLDYFDGKLPVFSIRTLLREPKLMIRVILERMSNSPKRFAANFWQNEDIFWTNILSHSNYALRLPHPMQAMQFGFDRFPSELYQANGKLPMACHAWHKYQYESFWRQLIALPEA